MADTADTKKTATKKATAEEKPKKRRLGRGLGSLLSVAVDVDSGSPRGGEAAVSPTQKPAPTEEAGGGRTAPTGPGGIALPGEEPGTGVEGDEVVRVQLLEVESIQPNQHQPRVDFDDQALKDLAASIEQSGLMQPIVVRSTGNTAPSGIAWEIIAGERRLRAIKSLGRTHVPAIVLEAGERESAELALIENLQREDLNPIERAQALVGLKDRFGLTQKEIASRVGLDRSSIANLIRILELDDFSIAAIRRGALTLGHAKALLTITDQQLRRTTAAAALNGSWSVRELERQVRQLMSPSTERNEPGEKSPITPRRANVVDLERRLAEQLGMRVHITLGRKKGSGKLQVAFDSLDQFDRLTELLGLQSTDAS